MFMIGINEFAHDAAAALLVDGQIIAAAEEERFSREKHHPGFDRGGGPPERALSWCLQRAGLDSLDQIDAVALAWRGMHAVRWFQAKREVLACFRRAGVRHLPHQQKQAGYAELAWDVARRYLRRRRYLQQLARTARIVEIEHHLAHASYAYRTSPFEEALIFVLDGSGEDVSTSVYCGRGNCITALARYPISQSVGVLYAVVTRFLGLGRDGEGKTMALAGYGEPLARARLLRYEAHCGRFRLDYDQLARLALYQRSRDDPIDQIHKNIAATLQRDLNDTLASFADHYLALTGMRNVCLAGGVALNCTLNGLLQAGPRVAQMYIPSAPNDAGTALGAVLELQGRFQDCYKLALDNSFLGLTSSESQIRCAIEKSGLCYRAINGEPTHALVDDLLAGAVVGLYRREAEFGPRALGNRSILADPTREGIRDRLNARIKHRELWRPFGVMLLEEDVPALFGRPARAPFMNVALPATDHARRLIPELVHIDGTVRVQTVNEANSPYHRRLLSKVKNRLGYGVLLNTSFNDRGEPLVNTPEDAIRTFCTTDLDLLYLGDHFRCKKPY